VLREIHEATGIPITTIWEIIHSWPDQEWFQRATIEFENMVAGVLANYQRRIASGDGTAAHDLAFGLGLLRSKQTTEVTGPGGGPVLGDTIIVLPSNGRGTDPTG